MLKNEIEQKLIDLAIGGDVDAFSEIYFRLRDSIYAFAYRLTYEPAVAEDITQEVFMFFVEFPEKFDFSRGTLFTFLCGVTRNKAFNYLKKSGTRLETIDLEPEVFENLVSSNGTSPLHDLLDKEFSANFENGVEKLSPFQREVLILREIEDLSYAEIAKITETEIGVVKSRLYRARRSLVSELAPYLKNSEEKFYEMH